MEIKVGHKDVNNSGLEYEVVSKLDSRNFIVRFKVSGYETKARKDYITKNTISDPNTITKYGVGYIGEGIYKTTTDELTAKGKHKASEAYTRWSGMMQRCYDIKGKEYPRYGEIGVRVCEEWKCFQNYAKFFYAYWQEGLQLDKDILEQDNKLYCPEKCKFVPIYINNLLIHQKNVSNGLPVGVYYLKKGPNMKNELNKPYMVEWKKKSLGTFSCPMEAHKAWQTNKALHIETAISQYSTEKWFDTEVACALMSRVWRLRSDAAAGIETARL